MAGFSVLGDETADQQLGVLIERHGAVEVEQRAGMKKEERDRAWAEAFKDVRDRPGLFRDLMNFIDRHSGKGSEVRLLGERIKDVRRENASATATMIKQNGTNQEIGFSLIDGRWLLELRSGSRR